MRFDPGSRSRFLDDRTGITTVLFGILLPILMVGIGGSIELARAVEYKQRLISAADLSCRQAEVYVESLNGLSMPNGYVATVQSYADRNGSERNLSATAQITATPTVSSAILTVPPLTVRPGNIHVVANGSVGLFFKAFLNKDSFDFTVMRDCAVQATSSSGPPTVLMSESFEGYAGQLVGGWGVFGTMSKANCPSSLCQGQSWGTTNAGVEVDQLSAIATGDGVQYGQSFAELDSDCSNRVGTQTAAQKTACAQKNQTTNSSINMTFDLPVGSYEVRYVYTARKNVGAYQYPNDTVICSNPQDTDGLTRDGDVAKNAAGVSTVSLDGQTRRIELWVEPKTSQYKSDDQSLTAASNPDYVKQYMADVCIWSKTWIERSYKFSVTKKQEYRISWRAAGLDDSFGGLIDYLRFCQNSCP
ncbi:TadE/TadG family type IV pilus assembly protein [Methylobacterium sp. SyP6R]|uniref:TadE/TadG family type IV pilus assembly protein n=1 Tax=Methylobacterium sp. SyP6R TaxID=2718876 RepID=UPI001F39673E|nr:TadE/TadG family type IV pilus assembly protein [Methylobacterium sp. SyP6R]MCF4125721.1 pilus assembly protein [Methylobacterium sp. SyP6R]